MRGAQKVMKNLITAASNQQRLQVQNAGVRDTLSRFKKEMHAYMLEQKVSHPELYEKSTDHKHPLLSFIAALDVDAEAHVIDTVDKAGMSMLRQVRGGGAVSTSRGQ